MSKTSTKKKDTVKNSYLFKSDDEEIKVELEAMSGLEYNLHGEKEIEVDSFRLPVRKSKMPTVRESNKVNDKMTMDSDKIPLVKEKIDVESSIPYLSSSVSQKELHNVIKQAGYTSEDRFKILEARDRLMRLREKKVHTLETAKATVGTCSDMCPEKERLMREFQRQVASYELLDCSEYKINHEIAIKQYSRSSADQEEPMPQDLRPVSSLKMTMSYLLHEIADLSEENGTNLAEWYHFLWDRTRGIRKDITQQELCCVDTVELVEECARFHIVCSERLCAEELSVFDKKINTENLTKCLQTLKYMYHDLRVKGINCKNEPEFRAYIILLNLNDANFSWDLQRLPSCIQKSPEVNFAVRVYSAIQSNNYAKFFKLVKSTTYLNACILLRYFFQVRVQALSIMVKAYCRTTSTAYPLYEFMDTLAFDDENETIYFCEQSGLNISDDEMHIILNRQNIISPSQTSDQGRAKNIVQAKRVAMGYTIGQAIAGGKMPEQFYINHKPHNSFDSHGYLKPEAINASDQSGNNEEIIDINEEQDLYEYMDEYMSEETTRPCESTSRPCKKSVTVSASNDSTSEKCIEDDIPSSILPVPQHSKETHLASNIDESVKFPFVASRLGSPETDKLPIAVNMSNKIIPNNINLENSKFTLNEASNQNILFGEPAQKSNNIFAPETISFPENVFQSLSNINTLLDAQPRVFARPIKLSEATTNVDSGSLCNNFHMSEIKTMAAPNKELEVEQSQEGMKKQLRHLIDESAVETAKEIETEVTHDVCSLIFNQEIQKDAVCDRFCDQIFGDVFDNVTLKICKNILEEEITTQQKIQDISNRVKHKIIMKYYIIWCQRVFMKKQQRRALDNTPVWLPKYSLTDCANSLYSKEQNLVIQNMRCKRKINDYNDNDDRNYLVPVEVQIYDGIKKNAKGLDIELSLMMFWKMIISWPDLNKRFLLGRYKKIMCEYICPQNYTINPMIKTYEPNSYETLNICIQHTNDTIDVHQVTGTDGLLFIAISDENSTSILKRLKNTVLLRQKLMRLPLVFVYFGNEIYDEKAMITDEIKKLVDLGHISEYIIYHEIKVDENIILKITQTAIDWLTCHKSSPLPLEMNYLSELINSCLIDDLWLRISGHASFNVNLSIALKIPQFIIDMHNEAVAYLIDVVNDQESLMCTSFPLEFKQFLPTEFSLPCTYEYFDDTWSTAENRHIIENIIRNFLLPPWNFDWPIDDPMELQKCIVRYLENTVTNPNYSRISYNILSNICYMSDETATPNFIHVILRILKERLRNIDANIPVIYNKNYIKHFQTLPWWFESHTFVNFNGNNKIMNQSYIQLNEEPAEKKRRIEKVTKELPLIIKKYENYADNEDVENTFILDSHFDNIFNISQLFEQSLSKQLLNNKEFETKLESALCEIDMNI